MSRLPRAITLLMIGVILVPAWALADKAPVSAASIDCSKRYAILYQNFQGGGGARTYCFGYDRDIESEPGNVMGPLGDETGTYLNDFDTNANSSGVSSVRVWDAAGGSTYGLCLYANKDYSGASIVLWGTVGPVDLVSPYVMNDVSGSLKFITAPGSCGT